MATPLPDGITQAELDRYAKLDAAIKRANAEHKTLNDKIKKAFKTLGTFICGSVIVKRTEADVFDAAGFQTKYPYASHEQYYDLVPMLKPKANLPEDVRKEFESKQQRLSVDVVTQ